MKPVAKKAARKAPVRKRARRRGARKSGDASPSVADDDLTVFRLCIGRAENLIKIHAAAHGKKSKPERYLADAHRAAIVLAVSALDAFVRSFVISKIKGLVGDKSLVLPPALQAQVKSFLKDDALLEAARKDDLLERVGKAFSEDFAKKSFQGTRQISECLKLVGYTDVFHSVAVNARENEDELKAQLDSFTQRRHEIAHKGDYDLTTNPPEESPITKRDAQDCIRLVTLIAETIVGLRGING